MLMVEENHTGTTRSASSNEEMVYIEADQPCSRGRRGGSARTNGGRNEQKLNTRTDDGQGPSTRRKVKVMSGIIRTRRLIVDILARRDTKKTIVGKSRSTLVEPKPVVDKSRTMSIT